MKSSLLKSSTYILLLLISHTSLGQSMGQYLGKEFIGLDNILGESFLETENKALSSYIGNSQIIMLGEQHHGDGGAFEVKARLVQYLHKYHGFDVVLFENDFFAGHQSSGESDHIRGFDAFYKTLWKFWADPVQMENFWSWAKDLHQTGNPVSFAGFDVNLHSSYSRKYFLQQLDSVVRHYQPPIASTDNYNSLTQIIEDMLAYKSPESVEKRAAFERDFEQLTLELVTQGLPENSFWYQSLRSFQNMFAFRLDFTHRDKGMAENVIWLKEQIFAGRKIILWAQNVHIFKEVEDWYLAIPSLKETYDSYIDKEMGFGMGKILSSRYQNIKSISLLSYSGSYSPMAWAYRFDSVGPVSMKPYEGLARSLHNEGHSYGLLPLSSVPNGLFDVPANVSGHGQELKLNWSKLTDAFLFLDKMTPIRLKSK